jgi:hypothetical protein
MWCYIFAGLSIIFWWVVQKFAGLFQDPFEGEKAVPST